MPAKKPRPGRGVQPTGRPSLMTEERINRIVQAVRGGSSRAAAAGFAGIRRATLQEWLARGHSGEQPYADFVDKVEEAEGTLVTQLAAEIVSAKDWRAKAYMIERKDPAFRRPPEQVEISNPDGSLQPLGLTLQTTPEAVRKLRELRQLELSARPVGQPSALRTLIE